MPKAERKIRYLSLFAGIEAWSCAVAGMPEYEAVAFSEIDPFACAVLAQRYPDVPNLGDVTQIDGRPYRGLVNLIVGGSPCQGFSVGGQRKGLDDERSCLALEYVRLVDEVRSSWILWENVPGCTSTRGGADLRAFFSALSDLGYSFAWTVLDSQHFGVAQRRRRLFLVGHTGTDWERPAKVLLDPKGMCGRPPASRKKRREDFCPAQKSTGDGREYNWIAEPVAGALCARDCKGTPSTIEDKLIAQLGKKCAVRRITPVEAERLQGFPDGWTNIEYNGKPAPDTLRYKALGNSMTVNVMAWIARQILKVESNEG